MRLSWIYWGLQPNSYDYVSSEGLSYVSCVFHSPVWVPSTVWSEQADAKPLAFISLVSLTVPSLVIIFPLLRLVARAWWGELHASRNWLHLSDNNNSCHLLSLCYVLGVEASYLCYLHLWFQSGLEQQEHSKVFFTRLCTLTKRHPRVGLGPLHPLPTCGEASARGLRQKRGQTPRARRGSGREKRIRPLSLNDSRVQPTGNAWPLRICLSTYWTYYPSTGLHIGDRSNEYGLSLWDLSLDVLLVALLFCCDPCWEGLEWERVLWVCAGYPCDVIALVMGVLQVIPTKSQMPGLLFGILIWTMFLSFQKSWAFYSGISEQCQVWSRLSLSGYN